MSDSLFGPGNDPQSGPGPGYLVLARKYRPRAFADLIGQEAMVRTIANSFALGRIPHAYMLTGVRGVGKTTTARLLARALNYKCGDVNTPNIDLDPAGENCQAIMESRHPDVFEMDAASRTGIGDIREILDSVRYAPVMARNKVYIIDEVHMLSTQAFNGLLKTLEEPPPHVKFIFATTEIRKVPVTVLSRCQRFDLKRIGAERLAEHLAGLCAKENVKVDAEGLMLIARAAEGSARDALSLLDQALVQKPSATVTAHDVREMLGLADRGRVLTLFEAIAKGDSKSAITEARSQYDSGADPTLILRDLLEIGHDAARAQALGAEARIIGGADWVGRIRALAAQLTPAQLSRLWQMLLKALEETGRAPDPIAAVEMALVRLCAAQNLPPPEDAARLMRSVSSPVHGESGAREARDEGGNGARALNQAAARPDSSPPPKSQSDFGQFESAGREAAGGGGASTRAQHEGERRLQSFDDVVALVAEDRDVDLEVALERHMRVTRFASGEIVFIPANDMPSDLPRRLMRVLRDATGSDWRVRPDEGYQPAAVESLAERRKREDAAKLEEIARHPFVAEALKAFPGAKIVDVRQPAPETGKEADIVSMPQRGKPTDKQD